MLEYDLWVTDRCAREDLGIDQWPDPEGVVGVDHEAVRKFRDRRQQDPEPTTSYIDAIKSRRCFKLKDERLRGATWFDRDRQAVYLLAVKYRESGSRDDAYSEFAELERSYRLFPTGADEDALAAWRAGRWLRELRDVVGPDLRAGAEAEPGMVFSRDIGQCEVALVAEPYDGGWFFQLRLDRIAGHAPIGDVQAAQIAAAILRDADVLEHSGTWYGEAVSWECRAFGGLYV